MLVVLTVAAPVIPNVPPPKVSDEPRAILFEKIETPLLMMLLVGAPAAEKFSCRLPPLTVVAPV